MVVWIMKVIGMINHPMAIAYTNQNGKTLYKNKQC
jgi:hypothetical protein